MKEEISSVQKYVLIYFILLALLGLNLGTAFMGLGSWRLALQLSIAAIQDVILWGFYMHFAQEKGPTRVLALLGMLWFLILVTLTVCDFVSRGWLLFPAKWPAVMHFSPPL